MNTRDELRSRSGGIAGTSVGGAASLKVMIPEALTGHGLVGRYLHEGDGHLLARSVPVQDEDRTDFGEVGRACRNRYRRCRRGGRLPRRPGMAAVLGGHDRNSDDDPHDGDGRAGDGAADPVPFPAPS